MKANKIGVACSTEVETGECMQGLMGKYERKRSLGRRRLRVRVTLKRVIKGRNMMWIELNWLRIQPSCVPHGVII